MAAHPVLEPFGAISRWAPRPAAYWVLRPQKAWARLREEPVPLAIRIDPASEPGLAGREALVRWSYDPERLGNRLCLRFESERRILALDSRWRTVAAALWRLIRNHPAIAFHDIPVDLEDGASPDLPDSVFCFARPKGARNALLPNPYLLQKRRRVPRARPWSEKTDWMYFRGADTGSPEVERNTRVVLCRTAAALPRTDCRLTRLVQGGPEFHAQIRREGLVGKRAPLPEMNRHRFLVDTDGNTTSWDRYLWTGTFGGVPILFEPTWEECWHGHLVEGENCLVADRTTLGEVLARLRADDALAQRLAAGAARLVATVLSPAGVQELFETAWLERTSRIP
jgi:hypothetical protein